jgi:hypothetical protein
MWRTPFEILRGLDLGDPVLSLRLPPDTDTFGQIVLALHNPWFVINYNDSSCSELAQIFRSNRVNADEVWNRVRACFLTCSNGIELATLDCHVIVRERHSLQHITIGPLLPRELCYAFRIYISEQPMPMERTRVFLSRLFRGHASARL